MADKSFVHMLPDAEVSHIRRKFLDIPYADRSEFEKLDIYLPDEGEGPFPTIIFIHGGAWYACDKRDTQIEPYLSLLPHGYAIAGINYRLSGEAPFPAGLQDCKAAVRYLKANANKYCLDAGRMALAGQSAGAYYVLMLAVTEGKQELEDLSMGWNDQDTSVRCVVSWYAPTDIPKMHEQLCRNEKKAFSQDDPSSPEARYLGGRISSFSPEVLKLSSPIYHIHPDIPPILLQHGYDDALVPYQQSETFYEQAVKVTDSGRVTLELFKGAGHADAVFETEENMERVRKFFDACLKCKE